MLLSGYLERCYAQASAAERSCFEALLARSDLQLEDALAGRAPPASPQEARVLERILGND